jgi:5'-deoxynucleotidase YfbR-like HD superfamily hydrolase
MRFLLEADKLKHVSRTCLPADGSRRENSAEHSWYLALMAMVLRDCAPEPESLEVSRALEKKRVALEGFPELWGYTRHIVESAAKLGLLGADMPATRTLT